MRKKILFLTQYDSGGASSRIRIYQFLPFFQNAQIEFSVKPLIKGNANRIFSALSRGAGLFNNLWAFGLIFGTYFTRLGHILSSGAFDLVVVQKDVLPFGYSTLLRILAKKIVYEYDDPIWLSHSSSGKDGIIKKLSTSYRRHCLISMLKMSDGFVADTQPLFEYASKFCSKGLLMTSPIDCSLYNVDRDCEDKSPCFVWIGSPGTTYLLEDMFALFHILARSVEFKLLNVGGNLLSSKFFEVENIAWSIENERDALKRAWAGIVPMDDTEFNKYKFGYKAWQYFAAGIPAIGPSVGMNPQVIEHEKNGICYLGANGFLEGTRKLLVNNELRRNMGLYARAQVRSHNDLPIQFQRLSSFLAEIY